jgi:hypothetical protein
MLRFFEGGFRRNRKAKEVNGKTRRAYGSDEAPPLRLPC